MMMRTTWRASGFLALAVMTLSASTAAAQYTAPVDPDRAAEAARLEQQARETAEAGVAWVEASKLFRRAADLQADEPDAARNHHMAGLMAFYAGRNDAAITDLTRAGDVALAWGDVVLAARAYFDAAWVAGREGRATTARDLAQKGERLARSPLLLRQDRAALLDRIVDGLTPPQRPTF